MANPPLSDALARQAVEAFRQHGSKTAAARALGLPWQTLHNRLNVGIARGFYDPQAIQPAAKPFSVEALPSAQADIDEIVQRRIREYGRRRTAKDARKLIGVRVSDPGPIGLLVMGDPHLDDPGTNLPLVMQHMELINRTDGLFGACIGDFINNWRGKLAHLHASQGTTQQEAIKLLEWYVRGVRWLFLIGGNHDVWQGHEDVMNWLTRGIGAAYEWHGCRLALRFPCGREVRINARHTFAGHSIYNKAQGGTRAIRFRGEDHVYVSGHIHTWAHYCEENPALDMVCHAVQLAAYKEIDDYADAKGYEATRHGAACVLIVNPKADTPHGLVTVRWDVEEAAEYLTWLRHR